MYKEQIMKDMTIRKLAQRYVELEWPSLYHPLRARLVEETVTNLQTGYVTRAEVEAMVQEMEELHNDWNSSHDLSDWPYCGDLVAEQKMNSRIQALAEQAEDWTDDQNFYESDYRDYLMEKFAELIVQECIDKIDTYQIPVGNSAAGEMACECTYNALKEIRNNNKVQFGVE